MTIGIIVVFIILFAVVVGASGGSSGFLGLIFLAAAIGGIRAIWKKNDDTDITKQ